MSGQLSGEMERMMDVLDKRLASRLALVVGQANARAAAVRVEALARTCRVCDRGMVGGQPAAWRSHGACTPSLLLVRPTGDPVG